MAVAAKKHHHRRRAPLSGLPPASSIPKPKPPPQNIWAVLFRNGDVGVFAAPPGAGVPNAILSQNPSLVTLLGNTRDRQAALRRLSKWSTKHSPKLHEIPHGLATLFKRGLTPQGVRVHGFPNEANPDPAPAIIGTAIVGGVVAGDLAAGAEAGEVGAAEGAAAGGAAGAGGGAGIAGTAAKIAGGVGAASVAGLFTNIGWWKGAGMIVIGVVLGILAIREFSP